MTDTIKARSRRDVIAGVIFIVIAAGFAWEATHYQMGTALRMGPGFMPLLLAGVLALFGAIIAFQGFSAHEMIEVQPVAWRGIVLICVSLAIFGYAARSLGLVPIVILCTFLTAMASRSNTPLSAGAIALVMAGLCYLIFKVGLGITLPTFGPALSF